MIVGSIDKEWLQVIDMRRLLERGVYFKVCGKRKREVGPVVPGCYWARTNQKKVAEIFSQEIEKIKERYPYFKLDIEQDAVLKPLLVNHEES